MRVFCCYVLIFLATASVAPASSPWGVNSGLETEEISDAIVELGAQWVRLPLDWFRIEKSKGNFDWSVPDVQISRARERKLNLYLILYGTPQWANGGKSERHPPNDPRDWADFVTAATERYAGYFRVKAFGMWNEPNVKRFWSGTRDDYLQKILIPGYKAVKAVDPASFVGAPELSHHWEEQSRWKLWEIMKVGAQYMDVVTLHYYPDSRVDFPVYLDSRVKPHISGKPLWITEIGMMGCSQQKNSADRQEKEYDKFLNAHLQRLAWFQRIFFYRIWDPADNCDDGNGFGITFGSPIQKRPAFHIYNDFIEANANVWRKR